MSSAQAGGSVILMPLDGSEMSEFALPYAAEVATALGAEPVVARIVERTHWSGAGSGYLVAPQMYADLLAIAEADAQKETQRAVARFSARGLAARRVVEYAISPAQLVEISEREHASFVVMATHGRSGMARATLGSVADHVTRHGYCPTLLVRARGRLPEHPALADALLPLDGSAMSEVALPTLARLAGKLVQRVTLLRVIEPDARSGISDTAQQGLDAIRERIEQEMESLRGHVETLLLWGAPGQQILEESKHHDLIIMATHGETGATRWAFGSVADEALHDARTPLLLTHPATRAGK